VPAAQHFQIDHHCVQWCLVSATPHCDRGIISRQSLLVFKGHHLSCHITWSCITRLPPLGIHQKQGPVNPCHLLSCFSIFRSSDSQMLIAEIRCPLQILVNTTPLPTEFLHLEPVINFCSLGHWASVFTDCFSKLIWRDWLIPEGILGSLCHLRYKGGE